MITRSVKMLVFAICLVIMSPFSLLAAVERWLGAEQAVFTTFSQLLSLLPGPPGVLLRSAYYCCTLDACSWEVHIGFGTVFSRREASIGRRASTGAYCVIGHASIGARAMIGSRVSIPSGSRQHLDADGRLTHHSNTYERVVLGEECWIGEGAIVMADVGARSIVSAGSVVAKAVDAGTLVGGNPARVIRALDAPATNQEA
jgi:virginiamycin A acetyltransferase